MFEKFVSHRSVLVNLARFDGNRDGFETRTCRSVDTAVNVSELAFSDDLGQIDSGSVKLEIPSRARVIGILLVDYFSVVFAQHLEGPKESISKTRPKSRKFLEPIHHSSLEMST